MAAGARGDDQRLAHPPALAVGHEAQPAEVDLALTARRRVVDAHRRRAPSRPAALDRKARQRAMRNLDTPAGQQHADLDHRELLGDPLGDLRFLRQQRPPARAVAIEAVRADPFAHLADQLVGELLDAAGAVDTELDRRRDVAPCRRAGHADRLGHRPLTLPAEPPAQQLFDLDHRDLPERHWASSAPASEAEPNCCPAGVGGCSGGPTTGNGGGPMPLAKPAVNWSNHAGKRQAVHCGEVLRVGWAEVAERAVKMAGVARAVTVWLGCGRASIGGGQSKGAAMIKCRGQGRRDRSEPYGEIDC